MVKAYYNLTKPGIVRANVITAIAGFLFAGVSPFNLFSFVGVIIGVIALISSGCAINNVLDKKIDSKMERTQKREIVTGTISKSQALIFALIMFIVGFASLFFLTNILVVGIGLISFISYVALYGYTKRKTYLGAAYGTIPGSGSIIAGYVAATGRLSVVLIAIFACLAFWQLAHFYAIAVYRKRDYARANVPVISVGRETTLVRKHILAHIFLFTLSLLVFFYISKLNVIIALFILLATFIWGYKVASAKDLSELWAKHMYKFSLTVINVYAVGIALNGILI